MNQIKISQAHYNELLQLFPVVWHDKLRIYTAEELFYVYMLCKFKPCKQLESEACPIHGSAWCRECANYKIGDLTYATVRAKLIRYLKGAKDEYFRTVRPVPPQAIGKLGVKFRSAYEEEFEKEILESENFELKSRFKPVNMADVDTIEKLKVAINGKRVA